MVTDNTHLSLLLTNLLDLSAAFDTVFEYTHRLNDKLNR